MSIRTYSIISDSIRLLHLKENLYRLVDHNWVIRDSGTARISTEFVFAIKYIVSPIHRMSLSNVCSSINAIGSATFQFLSKIQTSLEVKLLLCSFSCLLFTYCLTSNSSLINELENKTLNSALKIEQAPLNSPNFAPETLFLGILIFVLLLFLFILQRTNGKTEITK